METHMKNPRTNVRSATTAIESAVIASVCVFVWVWDMRETKS